MLFWPPADASTAWLAVWGLLLSLGYTSALIPFSAWGAELATDYHGRSRITGWREGLILVGTLIAIALPFTIGFDRAEGVHGLAMLGIAVLVTLPLFGAVAIFATPEPVEHSKKTRLNLKSGIGHLARNRPFVRLIAAFFLNGLANGIPATLFLYFVSARLGLPDARGPLLFFLLPLRRRRRSARHLGRAARGQTPGLVLRHARRVRCLCARTASAGMQSDGVCGNLRRHRFVLGPFDLAAAPRRRSRRM